MRVKFSIRIPLQGCDIKETLDLEDDLTDDELQQMYFDWQQENLEGGWERESGE